MTVGDQAVRRPLIPYIIFGSHWRKSAQPQEKETPDREGVGSVGGVNYSTFCLVNMLHALLYSIELHFAADRNVMSGKCVRLWSPIRL